MIGNVGCDHLAVKQWQGKTMYPIDVITVLKSFIMKSKYSIRTQLLSFDLSQFVGFSHSFIPQGVLDRVLW